MYLVFCWVIVPILTAIIGKVFFPEQLHRDCERMRERKREKEKHRRPLTEEEQEAIDVAVMGTAMYFDSHK